MAVAALGTVLAAAVLIVAIAPTISLKGDIYLFQVPRLGVVTRHARARLDHFVWVDAGPSDGINQWTGFPLQDRLLALTTRLMCADLS